MVDEVCDNLTVNKNSNLLGDLNINGNIGIGINNPKAKLHLFESGNQWSSWNYGADLLIQGNGRNPSIGILDAAGTNPWAITVGEGLNGGLNFSQMPPLGDVTTSPNVRFKIDTNGNVGIGTLTPSAKLEVNGDIKVTGDIILTNADCAEDFDIIGAESIEPGTVMVIDNEGALRASEQAYDRRVAGVISGAGDLRPGITLDRQKERANRLPLALTGKVYCKVDAEYNSISVGDMLTTSSTIGHAMKADDRNKSFGAVIGKALRPLKTGKGMIPVLVALQ